MNVKSYSPKTKFNFGKDSLLNFFQNLSGRNEGYLNSSIMNDKTKNRYKIWF